MIGTLRTLLAILFLVLAVPPAALVAFPWTFITGNANFLYWIGMRIVCGMVWLTGTKVEVKGLEALDAAGTYIFMSNHVSNLDPPVLLPVIPRRSLVLVKKELWRIPILAKALDLAELVPVERDNREAAIQSIRRAGEVMRHGINMMVYPEGTRSPDGRLLPFKKGPFHLAMQSGFPVVPVTMLGTSELMPKGTFASRGGTATVVFHPPIDPKQFASREDLMEAVADAIKSSLPAEKQ